MASAELLVDTDVLVDHLRGRRRVPTVEGPIAVSVVTRCELFAGRDEPEVLGRLLLPMTNLPIDATIAERAGGIRRATGIAIPDAMIAATALTHAIPLMTRNHRHFDPVAGLEVVAPG